MIAKVRGRKRDIVWDTSYKIKERKSLLWLNDEPNKKENIERLYNVVRFKEQNPNLPSPYKKELMSIVINDVAYDNASPDKRIGFIGKRHRYVDTKNPKHYYKSVTGLLKNYKEPFDAQTQAERSRANPNSKYFGMSVDSILAMWRHAADIGTELHTYAESLFNGIPASPPNDPRAVHVPSVIEDIFSKGYELAKTELLVYSTDLRLAGQSDLVLKKTYGDKTFYQIYDFKFLNKPIQKKSYYNKKVGRYKNMSGPFRFLNDCNWIHYSIQLAIYETLTGDPSLVSEKVLIVITDDGFEYVPAYPMRVFWDENEEIQAIYETWNGKYYDSRLGRMLNNKPTDIVGL